MLCNALRFATPTVGLHYREEKKYMRNKNYIIVITIVFGLLFSCKTINNESESDLKKVFDLKGKFEIELPSNWHKEYNSTEFSSGIISSDTTKEVSETIIINVNWNQDTIYINSHLEKLMDSLNLTVGLETKIKKSGRINEYRTYFNYSTRLDSTTELRYNQLLYILNSDSISGHILLMASIYGDSISQRQSEQIAEIVKSIKLKK